MNFQDIKRLEEKYYSRVFSRLPVAIERGEGMYLYDFSGKRYLDMFSGIAVCSLGHAHPEIIKTIEAQARKLMHVSNWYYTLPQLELAKKLANLSGLDRVFITNSGTEAIETAIKLVIAAKRKGEIIAMKGSFHGRTLGALSLTWEEKYRKPYESVTFKAKFAEYGDISSVKKLISKQTAAIILEPIQGESGVRIPPESFIPEIRELCSDEDIILILDEVQTGFGRTGEMFEFQRYNIKPDILCLAKGLGTGFPIGAVVFKDELDFEPGLHGGTFSGNPLGCEIAKKVIEVIEKEALVENSRKIGKYLLDELLAKGAKARGRGLMIGIDVDNGKEKVLELINKGILTIYSRDTVRVLPPLIINKDHADEFLEKF